MDCRKDVYELLGTVPRDKVTTYSELARAAGTHPRAVAIFMKTNSDPMGVECFRVVMSDGKIGGYSASGGDKMKEYLLRRSGIGVKDGKVDLVKHLHRF